MPSPSPGPFQYRALWLTVGWAMLAAVIWLSLVPSPPSMPDFPDFDKLAHGLAYLTLMAWFGQLYPSAGGRVRAATGLTAMGLGIEILQGLGGVREASGLDMLANLGGILTGGLIPRTRLAKSLSWMERQIITLRQGR